MLGCEGKLTHLGLDKAPARSTLSNANNNRSYLFFEILYFDLVHKYHSFISDSRLKELSIRNLKIIDGTTIRLFSDILQGVGRNPTDGSRKKGKIKVHTLMDAFSGIAQFVKMTAANCTIKFFFIIFNYQQKVLSFLIKPTTIIGSLLNGQHKKYVL